jgi:hypothetical protein
MSQHVCKFKNACLPKNFIDLMLKHILYIVNPEKVFWYHVTCILFLTSHQRAFENK